MANKTDGLLIYETHNNLINIGDYIQSLAAKQFLNNPIQYVSREKLDEYKGDHLNLIMNGWFLHNPTNWPPSENIHPIFVAFHINSSALEMLSKKDSGEYFKKNEPIGCRDRYTVELLKKEGVQAYFTGCLTLTLGETYSDNNKNNKIYFVDPFIPDVSGLSALCKAWKILINISELKTVKIINSKKRLSGFSLTNLVNTINFVNMYTGLFSVAELESAEYVDHLYLPNQFFSEDEKFKEAERLLKNYAQAGLVITSRIHCALPCLAVETPVLYTDDFDKTEISSCRLDGLLELFTKVQFSGTKMVNSELSGKKVVVDGKVTFKNKNLYKKLKDNLISILVKNGYKIRD